MRLKALQGLDREKLQAEYKELEEKIAYFLKVLSDDALVRSILKEELSAIAEKYGDDRKTEIQDVEDEIDIEDLIEEESCVFTLTAAGYMKRMPVDTYRASAGGARGSPPRASGRRTMWTPYSPPPATTISSSSPAPAGCTGRRGTRSPRPAVPPRVLT